MGFEPISGGFRHLLVQTLEKKFRLIDEPEGIIAQAANDSFRLFCESTLSFGFLFTQYMRTLLLSV
jgi:hypothetical protein